MTTSIISPTPIVLDDASYMTRDATRPLHLQEPNYAEKYDDRTLFYDIVADGDELILVGPPLLNLEEPVKESRIRINGKRVRAVTTKRLERAQLTRITAKSIITDGSRLQLSHPLLGDFDIRIDANRFDLFKGSRVLMTMQKDEELKWIEDWANYYVRVHGVDSILLFDNNSSSYSQNEIKEALDRVHGLHRAFVVDWPFKYGPQGGAWVGTAASWDSDFCQIGAFQTARYKDSGSSAGVINADIDELVVPLSSRSLFDALAESESGTVGYSGHWIENSPIDLAHDSVPRFWNFAKTEGNGAPCTNKWTSDISRWTQDMHPTAHFVRKLDYLPSADFYTAHFRGLNSGWKAPDRRDQRVWQGEVRIDDELVRALRYAFPSEAAGLETAGEMGLTPVDMRRYRFRTWLRAELDTATRGSIPWKTKWVWKEETPVFEVDSRFGQVAFDIHVSDDRVRAAAVVRDKKHLDGFAAAIESIAADLDEAEPRDAGFWISSASFSSQPDASWLFAREHLAAQIGHVWAAISETDTDR